MPADGIIDFHTHAFPDDLAPRAIGSLSDEGGIPAYLDGRVSSLLQSMDRHGIERSVVSAIATKPAQFEPIMRWCGEIRSERIIPFPSLHPDDSRCADHIARITDAGFRGIKLHPFYQDFYLDEDRLLPLYESAAREGLIVVVHTGFDIAFPPLRRADPAKILGVLRHFPGLRLVATHLGAWNLWEEVEDLLIGREIYMEISCALDLIERERARAMILRHPASHILFGSDSPWTDQGQSLSLLRGLDLDEDTERLILRENALQLLGSD